jgi:curved DNA-binding protein CbpA
MNDSRSKYPYPINIFTISATILILIVVTTNALVTAWTTTLLLHSTSLLHQNIGSIQASLSSDEFMPNPIHESDQSPSFSYHEPQKATSSSTPSKVTMTTNTPTLYDILGASPNATRMELKQKYVTLARMTHPDAQRMTVSVPDKEDMESIATTTTTLYDFNDIATAYKILSDTKQRRRYDRSIQAEIITEQIAMAVQNHPITELTIKAIGSIAVPFFRTINKVTTSTSSTSTKSTETETTIATTSGESIDSSSSSLSLQPTKYVTTPLNDMYLSEIASTRISQSNIPQQQEYSTKVDLIYNTNITEDTSSSPPNNDVAVAVGNNNVEQIKNYLPNANRNSIQELEAEAQNEYNQLLQIQQNLQQLTQQRLRISLHTPQSGLNSNEAYLLLNSFPNTGGNNGPSWVERLNFLRSSVEAEINTLQNTEQAFIQQQQINTRAQNLHQTAIHDQLMIRQSLIHAERVEQEARRAMERAMDETRRQRIQYERISEELFAAENAAAYASNELERLQSIIQKQSENVRNALARKEKAILNNSNHKHESTSIESNDDLSSSKPEPPMSPLFTASSLQHRKLYKNGQHQHEQEPQRSQSQPPLVQSSEASMLDAWPRQSLTTTLSQSSQYLSSYTNMSLMEFEDNINDSLDTSNDKIQIDDTTTTTVTTTIQQQSVENSMDELNKLRQQEREMMMLSKTIESHISNLMEQINDLKQ